MKKHDFFILLVLIAVSAPLFKKLERARADGRLTQCKINQRDLGTAFEMYSTDWDGRYPENFALLRPRYLDKIPLCPVSGEEYELELGESEHNPQGFQDFYYLYCKGSHHAESGAVADQPSFNGSYSACPER